MRRRGAALALLLAIPCVSALEKVTMTQGQYCKSCTATVEALFVYAEDQAKEDHELDLHSERVADEMCSRDPFTHYKPFFKTGCEQIVTYNLTRLTRPLISMNTSEDRADGSGNSVTGSGMSTIFKSDALRFEHSRSFCMEIGACPETFFKMGRDVVKDKCKACHDFVWDFKVVLARENKINSASVASALLSLCEKLSLMHLRPAAIADACEVFVENWYEKYLEDYESEKLLVEIVDNFQPIMVGQYDIVTPMCSKYTKFCRKKKRGKSRKRKRGKKRRGTAAQKTNDDKTEL